MSTVTEQEFLQRFLFVAGEYEIAAVSRSAGNTRRPLLIMRVPRADYQDARHVPQVDLSLLTNDNSDRSRIMSGLVRAGIRHPGISDRDLRDLHRVARREGHVELFCDLNALSTGLVRQLVLSLGRRCCRVVVSSSSIDILHEYQGSLKKKDPDSFLRRAEMARCLACLEELRQDVAVHVHPLPPGTTFYMRRSGAEPETEESATGVTYISEDRQMVAAFWHYLSTNHPRVPVHLITTDFSLARVCAAERVPFIFAKSPNEVWGHEGIDEGKPVSPESVWFDPFALRLRAASAHRILLELGFVFQTLHVTVRQDAADRDKPTTDQHLNSDFSLSFDMRSHLPGQLPTVSIGDASQLPAPTTTAKVSRKTAAAAALPTPIKRRLKLSLTTVINAMPTRVGQAIPISAFEASDDDSLRQFVQIGQATDLFVLQDDKIIGREGLNGFLRALQQRDYVAVNAIFRNIEPYDAALHEAATGQRLPSSNVGGAVTGWAVLLGAAYKTGGEGTLYGLADIADERFEQAVVQAHAAIGKGQQSVQLPPIMDRVCRSLQLSPIRFEALLEATLGNRGLSDFEAQRARSDTPIAKHTVVVAPTTAASSSYFRNMDPGRGLLIGNKLAGALVKRGQQT